MAAPIDIPVVVIGGGGCGLTSSILLSDLNVEHILFEKHPSTSILPKAHYLNQRTMETYRHFGISDEITRISCPPQHMCRIEFKSSLGGDGPHDGRLYGYNSAWGNDISHPDYDIWRRDSPAIPTNLPLIRSEPILRRIAEERNPDRVLFSHAVEDFEEKDDRVLVTVNNPDGTTTVYRTQYVIAADGGKLSTPKLDIKMEGPTKIVDIVTTHFKADLSRYWDDRTLFAHFINPEGGKIATIDGGILVQMGPTWGRKSEEWVLHFGFAVDDATRFDKEALPSRIRRLLKLPELDMEVLHISHWLLDRVLADKYRQGRVFIAGDAAHRRPPTTGLGLNTSIEDAQNLVWKLAAVLQGKANPSLLDTYEAERRPIGRQNCDWALFTFTNLPVVQAAVGFLPGRKEYNQNRVNQIFEESRFGAAQVAQIQRAIDTQDIEFRPHDIELGFVYEQGASIPDGTDAPLLDPTRTIYIPTSRPGHRLPHAWIEKEGKFISTHDLLVLNKHDFFLITDEDGSDWVEEAATISKTTNVRIGAAKIRVRPHHKGTDFYYDTHNQWTKVRGIRNGGAILVRPDNFVAWRSRSPAVEAKDTLRDVLATLLGNASKQVAVHTVG